jgi:hypothetical protein
MSLQQAPPRDLFPRKGIALEDFVIKNPELPIPERKQVIMMPKIQLERAHDFSCASSSSCTTTTLHDAQDGKPTITLTSHTAGLPSPADSAAAASKHPERSRRAAWLDEPRDEQPALNRELDEYFQGLKSEFEAKTGKAWTPLRGWASKEWEWENEVDDEAVVWDWGVV